MSKLRELEARVSALAERVYDLEQENHKLKRSIEWYGRFDEILNELLEARAAKAREQLNELMAKAQAYLENQEVN